MTLSSRHSKSDTTEVAVDPRLRVLRVGAFLLAPVIAFAQAAPVDPARGRALVESNKCFDCHRIDDRGSRVGPDLSEIGGARTADQLRRALVAPDAVVLPEHRFVRIVTRDGQEVTGRLLNQDTLSIQIIDQREQLRAYLKSNLREIALRQKGLMPSYERTLTPDQIADVVGYLASLKEAAK